jgi:hypothetical protein
VSAIPACSSKTEPQATDKGRNSNVSKILPVTTFRTIDLRGRKISDRLFSRFCRETRVFYLDGGTQATERFQGARTRQHAENKWPYCGVEVSRQYQNGSQRPRNRDNSNVSKILPVTTFRTIDLRGRKISDRLFSRFCATTRVFFEILVHQNMCNS